MKTKCEFCVTPNLRPRFDFFDGRGTLYNELRINVTSPVRLPTPLCSVLELIHNIKAAFLRNVMLTFSCVACSDLQIF